MLYSLVAQSLFGIVDVMADDVLRHFTKDTYSSTFTYEHPSDPILEMCTIKTVNKYQMCKEISVQQKYYVHGYPLDKIKAIKEENKMWQ